MYVMIKKKLKLVCLGCKFQKINLDKGLVCGLNNMPPDFIDFCPNFSFLEFRDVKIVKKKAFSGY